MDKIKIIGGNRLKGKVEVSGSKNAALPILISSLLVDGVCHFKKVPVLQDIKTTLNLLFHLGVVLEKEQQEDEVVLNAKQVQFFDAPYDLVRKMRASILVLGPLLARFGRASVSLPGGCAIGARPIQFHLSGLEKLGASIDLENGYVTAHARKLKGNKIAFEFPSVGATENIMMAATLAEGESLLENCAKEPEIVDLALALNALGAHIEGAGTEVIHIQGKPRLSGGTYSIMSDRIEAGTFLIAAFATQGHVCVEKVDPDHLEAILVKLEEVGAKITRDKHSVTLEADVRPFSTGIITQPYPGFPTDIQAQFMALMTIAKGTSLLKETIFENRFMHVSELVRLGADVSIHGNTAVVKGQEFLQGADVMATDLRASASLIIGGLCAKGESLVHRIYHLDRGYENMEKKLKALGAEIVRIQDETK